MKEELRQMAWLLFCFGFRFLLLSSSMNATQLKELAGLDREASVPAGTFQESLNVIGL